MNSTQNYIRLLIIFLVTTLIQVVVLDNLEFLNLCNPFLYVVVLLSAPFGISPIALMLMSLPVGLAIDVASNTPGMHAAACVFGAYMRPYVLQLISFRSAYRDDDMPSVHSYGLVWYAKYVLIIVALHHLVLFFVEQFDGLFFWTTLLRALLSILASSVLIIVFSMLTPRPAGSQAD